MTNCGKGRHEGDRKGPAQLRHHPSLYHERAWRAAGVIMVEAGVELGRAGTLAVAFESLHLYSSLEQMCLVERLLGGIQKLLEREGDRGAITMPI